MKYERFCLSGKDLVGLYRLEKNCRASIQREADLGVSAFRCRLLLLELC